MPSPQFLQVVQGPTSSPYAWLTWDRNDRSVTKYDVLRDGQVVGTVGPFTPYDPGNAAHRSWYGAAGGGGYVGEVLADNPAYYFRLEQAGSAQTDRGPNGLTGATETPAGTPAPIPNTVGAITGDAENNAKTFDGNARFIISTHTALDLFAGAWWISTWVKRGTIGTEQHFWRRGTNAPLLKFQPDNTIRVRQFGVADIVGSTVALTDTAGWHQIVVTCAGPTSTPKIYLDGVDVTGAQLTAPNFANSTGFVNIGGGTAPFHGALDEPALGAGTLSAARVQAHYNARAAAPSAAVPPFDNTWDKCAYKDSTVVAPNTYSYQVRAHTGATVHALSPAASITIEGDAAYGLVRQVAAPSGGDDTLVLQAAIDTAQAEGGIAVLQAGTYRFSQLRADGRRMVLRGQGKDATVLRPIGSGGSSPGLNALAQITVTGSQDTLSGLAAPIAREQYQAEFTDVAQFGVGSVLMFTAPAVSGTALAAYARGDILKPGEEYDEANRWEANEVVSISGKIATFRFPFSQPIPASATVVRLSEPVVGTRHRGMVFERMSIEGVGLTDTTSFNNFDVTGVVGARWADVRSRWTNGHFVKMSRSFAPTFVGCEDPDHGPVLTGSGLYSLNLARVANARVIGCLFGTSGTTRVVSCVTLQRTPRALVRHCSFHWPKNYACNEHGGGSRDWIFENNWFELAPETVYGGVFCGNPDFANSGRGIIRNNRQDSGPILAYVREHGYGIRVFDNIAYGLVANPSSLATALVVWGGWDSPHEDPANWGAAKLTIGRNALFGSQHDGLWLGRKSSVYFGDGSTSNPDPAGDGGGFRGIKDVVVFANHLHVSRTRINLEGVAPASSRFQVRDTTGNGRPDARPAFTDGVHWANNGDGLLYGAATVVPWTEESFAWQTSAPPPPPPLPPVPGAPAWITASARSTSQIDVAWDAPAGSSSELQRALASGGPWTLIASVPSGGAHSDLQLAGATTYYYRARLVNAAGPGPYSAVASAHTGPPDVPADSGPVAEPEPAPVEEPAWVITAAELLDLRSPQLQSTVRFEIVDSLYQHLFDVTPDRESPPQVGNNIHATYKRTLQGLRLGPEDGAEVDPVRHRLRPVWVLQNGARFPLGVFMFSSPGRTRTTAGTFHEMTLFDQTFLLDQGRRSTFSRRAGSRITAGIRRMLREAGLPEHGVEESDQTFASPIGWPAGTTRKQIINDMCAMLGYYSLFFDNAGVPRCLPVPELDVLDPDHVYELDQTSRVIRDSLTETDDLWESPNVYLVISTSATDTQVAGSYEVPDSHPLSVVNRGYEVVRVIEVQGLETTAQATRRARAAAKQSAAGYQHLEFDAAPDPRHDTFDVVLFDGVLWREQSWNLTLAPGGPHRHHLRRLDATALAQTEELV